MVCDMAQNVIDFSAGETAAVVESYRIKPEFGLVIVSLYVDVRRLVTIPGIEKEAVGTDA
jgi:hypothetical protein